MRSSTPRRDAVERWIAGGYVGEIEWPEPDFDPCTGMTDEQRLEYVVAHAASGAQAELPVRYAVVAGKRIPPPPSFHHGHRNHPPRPRKVPQ